MKAYAALTNGWLIMTLGTLLLLGGGAALAQEQTPTPLTLPDALRLALEHNPGVAGAQADVQARTAALSAQRARRLPTLTASATGSLQRSLARTVSVGGGTLTTGGGTSDTSDLALTLTHTFYQSGREEAIASARASALSSQASLQDTQRQLLLQVADTWHTILAQQELATVADRAVRASEQHRALVAARIVAGTAAPADRLPIEAELAEARYELVNADSAVSQSLAELRALLALPPDALPVLRDSGELAVAPGRLENWVAEALAGRPDLSAQQYQVRIAELSARQARIAAGLSLDVQGQAEYGRFSGTTGDTWLVTAGVALPLYDRAADADVDQARASLESTRQRLSELELSVTREVAQAWHALADAGERVAAAEASVAAATSALEAAQARYAQGAATVIDLTDAELAARQASARLVQARYDRRIAQYQLLAGAGRMLVEPTAEQPAPAVGAPEAAVVEGGP